MLTLLKFSTENKFFQCDVINIPDFNVLQRKIPVQIVWICSGSWKQGTSPAFSVILSYFLVIVLILSITGRGAPVYLPTTRGRTFQSATNTGEMSLWAQWNKKSRPREGAEKRLDRDALALPGSVRDAELQGQPRQPGEAPSLRTQAGGQRDALFQVGLTRSEVPHIRFQKGGFEVDFCH